MASERRLRRISQAQQPNMPPKRSVSLRRAYHYVFRRERSPGPAPGTEPQIKPENNEPEQVQEKFSVEQPRSPTTRVEFLERQLQQSRNDLTEARQLAMSQETDIANLEERMQSLEQDYIRKEEALREQKAKIEENMVTVVLDQIRTAREGERAAAEAENKVAKDAFEHKYKSRVAILTQELENARNAKSESEDAAGPLRAERDSLSKDLEKAKVGLKEATEALHSLRSSSAAAISEAQSNNSKAMQDYESRVTLLSKQLKEAESGLHVAQSKSLQEADRYEQLSKKSADSATEAQKSLDALKQQLNSQIDTHGDELARLNGEIDAATAGKDDVLAAKAKTDSELADATRKIENLESQLANLLTTMNGLEDVKASATELSGEVESLKALNAGKDAQIAKLLEAETSHVATQQLLQEAQSRSDTLTKELEAAIGDTKDLQEERVAREGLTKDNAALQEKLSQLEGSAGKLHELQTSFRQQTVELEAARVTAQTSESQFTELEAENATLVRELTVFKAASEAHKLEIKAMNEQQASLAQQLHSAQADGEGRNGLEKQLAETKAEKEGADAKLVALQEELRQASQEKLAAEEKLAKSSAAAVAHTEQNSKLKQDLVTVEASKAGLMNQVRALETAQAALKQETSVKSEESATTVANLQGQLAAAQTAQKASEQVLEALQAKEASTEASSEMSESIAAAQAAQKKAETALSEAQAAATASAEEARAHISALTDDVSAAKSAAESTSERLADKETELQAAIAKHSALETAQSSTAKELENLRAEITALKESQVAPNDSFATNAEELEDLRRQLVAKDAELAEMRAWRERTELELDDLMKTPRSVDGSFENRMPQSSPSKTDAASNDTPPITPAAVGEADPEDVWDMPTEKGKKEKKGKSKKNSISSPVAATPAEGGDM